MKAAILGAGFIAGFHADGYARLPDVQLCAVCDVDPEKAARMGAQYGCAAYTDALALLEKERPDLVSVCLPTFLHETYAVAALQSGAHVLCEKPMALTMAACEHMRRAALESDRILMVGQVLRWWPEYQRIRAYVDRLGSPLYLRAQRLQHSSREGWFMQPDLGGGVLFDLLVHDLDFLCAVMGKTPRLLSADGHRGAGGAWRRVSVSLAWPGGACAHVEACNCMPQGYPFTASFHAEFQQAALDYAFRAPLNISRDAPTKTEFFLVEKGGIHPLPIAPAAQEQAFRAEIAAFAAGAQEKKSALPVEETMAVMALVHVIKDALEQRETP